MDRQVEERLRALEAEYDKGQKMLAELEAKRSSLTQTLLRIEGARQVLRELLEGRAAEPLPRPERESAAAGTP
jgi:predicted nuclease with TOPRIM domain